MRILLQEVARVYAERFGGAPTVDMVPDALTLRAAHVLLRRIELGQGFRDDTDFLRGLGEDPPWPR